MQVLHCDVISLNRKMAKIIFPVERHENKTFLKVLSPKSSVYFLKDFLQYSLDHEFKRAWKRKHQNGQIWRLNFIFFKVHICRNITIEAGKF